jgi:hypothetical protein
MTYRTLMKDMRHAIDDQGLSKPYGSTSMDEFLTALDGKRLAGQTPTIGRNYQFNLDSKLCLYTRYRSIRLLVRPTWPAH